MRYIFFIGLILLTSSCYKNHLFVQQEKIDVNFLASVHVGTPDPRLKHPPKGQRLNVSWDFPLSLFKENLTMILRVRFWNNTEDVLVRKIDRKRGYVAYDFQDDTLDQDYKILTYQVTIVNEDKKIVEHWNHQFWKERIEINPDKKRKSKTQKSSVQ